MQVPGNASPRNGDRQHPAPTHPRHQNLRIWMAASAPELNLAAAHSGGGYLPRTFRLLSVTCLCQPPSSAVRADRRKFRARRAFPAGP
jgi:hypothetical protein